MKIFSVLSSLVILIVFSAYSISPGATMSKVDFSTEMEAYYPLVEEALSLREQSPAFFQSLEDELDRDGHLSAASIHTLKYTIKVQKKMRKALFERAYQFEQWLDEETIDPVIRLKGVMFSLSAAIVLYDNYLFNLSMFQRNRHLRQIANTPDREYHLESLEVLHASEGYTSLNNYLRVKKAILFYREALKKGYVFDAEMVYLQRLIEKSPSYRAFADKHFFKVVAQKMYFNRQFSTDTVEILSDTGINLFSEIFGNSVGLVVTRRGMMYGRNDITAALKTRLKAGDILIEKTPFRLTDALIPGYWGHAAIWTGTQEELRALGIWEHPGVVPYHTLINQNKMVIEALRSGVKLNTLEHFLNVDDMAVLREPAMSSDQRREVILHAFAQLGKRYDFNFNVETSNKIVCSELVYTSYPHIKWPTDKALGRYTISPDHIAVKTKSRQLELVVLYHKGEKVNDTSALWEAMLNNDMSTPLPIETILP
ncbi:MAG: YiiX/YebB-like N1pC/P60 family cysteine hydrolase [Sulfurimonadaceae bacterium]